MKIALIFLCVCAAVVAADKREDHLTPISKFVVAAPVDGTYVPWMREEESSRWFAGEIVTIKGRSFRYTRFTDVIDGRPLPDYSGAVKEFEGKLVFDHPSMVFPFRIAGVADGIPALLTWRGYEEWMKIGRVSPSDILFIERKEPNKAPEPTPTAVTPPAAQESRRP